ncbi:MAG: single-stranded-DNA-specific exonuclease RecJ [Gammaproteobacteria bacterium]|nr:MAG: single-stranded-DNA-specific exonuclease RecJ [Gammaproteobacteria bacterium]
MPLTLDDYPDDFYPCHRRVLSARRIAPDQLKKSLSRLHDVASMHNATAAAQRLYHSIQCKEKIVIVGDYDADGATAMSVVVSVLRYLHANVDTVVPNRVRMGYGLSKAAADVAVQKRAELVVTVDNGITAADSVDGLKQQGIDVIITDHHLPLQTLPNSDFIVNPNQPDCQFPSKHLAGVGVAFYLMLALRQVYRQQNDTALDDYPIIDLLPLVAIGTIADVVPLDFNNRILIENGLKRIRAGLASPGIGALIDIAGLDYRTINATDIAFQIAPRLNAAGRIADMQLGVDCLLAGSERLAVDYALELDRLNRERKAIENEMKIEADYLLQKQTYPASVQTICLFQEDWNEGLIGILASRLKDKYQKTAFVFTRSGDVLKASARAAEGVSLIEVLNLLNRECPHLLGQYGGHAKAAGLTLLPEQLPNFSDHIETIIANHLKTVEIDQAVYTDGELLPYELSVENAEFIKLLEPWGASMPEPMFENSFYIDNIREVGHNHANMQLIEANSGQLYKGIAFNQYQNCGNLAQQHCRIAYQLSVNEWRGQRSLTLVVSHIEVITH